jgi:hypothetical protein
MGDRIEDTIKEIAAKHGIAVGRDDPILILQTINERLMHDNEAALQQVLERHKEELEAIAHRWGLDAKDKAEKTLNAALTASRDAMAKAMANGGKEAADTIRREVGEIVAQVAAPIREGRRIAYMNMFAAACAVLASGLALWASR